MAFVIVRLVDGKKYGLLLHSNAGVGRYGIDQIFIY